MKEGASPDPFLKQQMKPEKSPKQTVVKAQSKVSPRLSPKIEESNGTRKSSTKNSAVHKFEDSIESK